MSELLKKHQKKEFRYESKDFKLYELTDYQRNELASMVAESSKIENEKLTGEVSLKSIRYIIRELTNVGSEIDSISNEELESLLKETYHLQDDDFTIVKPAGLYIPS